MVYMKFHNTLPSAQEYFSDNTLCDNYGNVEFDDILNGTVINKHHSIVYNTFHDKHTKFIDDLYSNFGRNHIENKIK
jgi:hypothetical protein